MWPLLVGGALLSGCIAVFISDEDSSSNDNSDYERRRAQKKVASERKIQQEHEALLQVVANRQFLNNKYSLGLSAGEIESMSESEFDDAVHRSSYYKELQSEVSNTTDDIDFLRHLNTNFKR